MKAKVSMIITSHLSDIQCGLGVINTPDMTNNRINFIKYLVFMYRDTQVEIDASEVYKEFLTKHHTEFTYRIYTQNS